MRHIYLSKQSCLLIYQILQNLTIVICIFSFIFYCRTLGLHILHVFTIFSFIAINENVLLLQLHIRFYILYLFSVDHIELKKLIKIHIIVPHYIQLCGVRGKIGNYWLYKCSLCYARVLVNE